MALVHPLALVSAAITAKDIRTPASVYQFVPTANGNVQIICRLTVAGGGDYVAYLTHQWLGEGVVSIVGPKTTITQAAGETYLEFVSLWIAVEATDVFEVMVDGLTGDSTVTGDIRIYADNPSVFDPSSDAVDVKVESIGLGTFVEGVIATIESEVSAKVWADAPDHLATEAEIADAVHDEAAAGHTGYLATNLDATVSGRAAAGEAAAAVAGIDKTGYALSEAAIDAILDEVIENGQTLRQLIRIGVAALVGDYIRSAGSVAFRDLADTKDRIVATMTSTERDVTALDGT